MRGHGLSALGQDKLLFVIAVLPGMTQATLFVTRRFTQWMATSIPLVRERAGVVTRWTAFIFALWRRIFLGAVGASLVVK